MHCRPEIPCFFRVCGAAAFIALASITHIPAASPPPDASLVGKPVIGRNADGVLEVFVVNAAGELRHRWQKESNGDWSPWSRLGTGLLPGIAVATDKAGRMEVFAVDRQSQTLRYITQRTTNSLEWSEWMDLGGAIRPPIAVGQDPDGRLEVFAVAATSGTVKHRWQTTMNNGWSPWSDLGGSVDPWLATAQNRDGRLELFGINQEDNTLTHCWQETPGASNHWTEWKNLGGSILPGFVVGRDAMGFLEVFAVNGTNGVIDQICQAVPSDSARWTQWIDFGARIKPGLALGNTGSGRMELFAVDAGKGILLHRWEHKISASAGDAALKNESDWSSWKPMGPATRTCPAVERNEDGDLELFAVDARSGKIIHRRQISSESGWLDWSTLDHRTPQSSSRLWQIDEGLPDNLVQAITQTRDGYLWVGTSEGLARFDGTEFMAFTPKNTPALKSLSITALCADRDGALWIGTDGGGLTRLKDGEFVHYGTADGLAGDTIHALCQIQNGSLWIGTDNGISRYQNGKFTNYTQTNGLLSDVVYAIYQDSDDDLWIATVKGLNRFRPDGTMDSYAMPNVLPKDSVRAICQDKHGEIWIGSNNGMLWYNRTVGRGFYPYNTRYGLSDPFVSAICEDRDGNLWVGTYSGLNRFREGKFYSQLDDEGRPFDKVNALFEDRQGNLWIGTEEGLARLAQKEFVDHTRQNGLTHNNITSVLEDRNGSLWIGTWGGGLDELTDGKITAYTSTNGLSRDLILSLCEGRDGSIWVGADYDGGLTSLKDGKVTHYTWRNGLPGKGLKALEEDSAGNLWIGTIQGLFRLANGKFTKSDHALGNNINTIYQDHEGGLWVGTDRGLSCWDQGKLTSFTTNNGLSDNAVIALFEDTASNLWIGTKSGGLDRLRNGKLTAYTSRAGLFSDEVFSILEDDAGWLWMSCSKGVFRVHKTDLDDFDRGATDSIRCIAYGKTDGMESPECNGSGKPSSWKDHNGRLWFPTSKGLVTVDPANVLPDEVPPAVHIEQVTVDRKPLIRDTQILVRDAASGGGTLDRLQIHPSHGELQFEYSALNLSSPEKSRFKYKLDGINADWVDAGTRRTAYYNNIPPGHYAFHVIACNKDGVWNKPGAALSFDLLPHYWQTWWFKVLLALLVVGGTGVTVRYVTRRKMQRKLELLKQRHAIENERGRIAKDIHDDLGSNLTRITMLGERVEEGLANHEEVGVHVRKIVTSARNTVQSMDEIVWAVNPENDTLDSLVGYISHHAGEFFEGTGVRCRLEIPVRLPRCALSSELRHNLFLVVKEAFNNVMKHAQASAVTVRVAAADSVMQIVIEDNGRGFDLNGTKLEKHGNGLANLSRRMENIGGDLQISARPGQGVTLQFTVKLEPQRRA
jgi:ligand-binding sensor domain-containing protein/signal transduction histidine kinase